MTRVHVIRFLKWANAMKVLPKKRTVLRLLGAVAALLFAAQLNAAYAVTVGSTSILPERRVL